MNSLIKALRESPEFQAIMTEIVNTRPLIPDYTPQKTRDETENLIEQIKHRSSCRQGWDILFLALTGKKP